MSSTIFVYIAESSVSRILQGASSLSVMAMEERGCGETHRCLGVVWNRKRGRRGRRRVIYQKVGAGVVFCLKELVYSECYLGAYCV